MKRTHVLMIAVPASALFLTAAPLVAVAATHGIQKPEQGQATMQATMQQMVPAEWRSDRYLAMPGVVELGIQEPERRQATMQPNTQQMVPAEWRADRYLAEASINGTGNQEIQMLEQQQTAMQEMFPAEWRADRYLAEAERACG